jgi:hypothetical protein
VPTAGVSDQNAPEVNTQWARNKSTIQLWFNASLKIDFQR